MPETKSQIPSPPLSPRLSIYAWHPGAIASIAHRASGVLLVLSVPFYLWILFDMTGAPEDFQHGLNILHSFCGTVFLWASGTALFFHFFNGLRFIGLDVGLGETRAKMRRSAQMVFCLTGVMSLLLLGFIL